MFNLSYSETNIVFIHRNLNSVNNLFKLKLLFIKHIKAALVKEIVLHNCQVLKLETYTLTMLNIGLSKCQRNTDL